MHKRAWQINYAINRICLYSQILLEALWWHFIIIQQIKKKMQPCIITFCCNFDMLMFFQNETTQKKIFLNHSSGFRDMIIGNLGHH